MPPHVLAKPAIVTGHEGSATDTPFNLRNERIVIYEGKDDLGRALKSLL